jgi:putative DNA primase/helicase
LRAMIPKLGNLSVSRAIWTLAKSMLVDPHVHKKMNRQHTHLLPVADGQVVDLQSGTLHDRTHDHWFSFELPVRLLVKEDGSIQTDLPQAEKFFRDIMRDDVVMMAYLQKVLGYCLTGSMSDRSLWIWWGAGSNGKSVLAKLLAKIMGPMACTMSKDVMIRSQRPAACGAATPHLVPLVNARMGMFTESEDSERLNEGFLKAWSGLDTISARPLYRKQFEFEPQAKLILPTNFKPVFDAEDQAAIDRVKMIPFTARFTHRGHGSEKRIDKPFIAKLMNEDLDQVFTWMVVGATRWYADQDLSLPSFAQKQMSEYVQELKIVDRFIAEECELGADKYQKRSELHAAFKRWCLQEDEPVWSARRFRAAIKGRGYTSVPHHGYDRWKGIQIKPWQPKDDDATSTASTDARTEEFVPYAP